MKHRITLRTGAGKTVLRTFFRACFVNQHRLQVMATVLCILLFGAASAQNSSASWPLTSSGTATVAGNLTAGNLVVSGASNAVYSADKGATFTKLNGTSQARSGYLEFSVSPANNFAFTLSEFSFSCNLSDGTSTNASFQVQYFLSTNTTAVFTGNTLTPTATWATTTLNSPNLTVSAGQTLSVRIYVWGLATQNTGFNLKGVNIRGYACPSVATITYPKTTYCKDPNTTASPTVSGVGGGLYSATPAGLSINSTTGVIDVTNSAAGTYTILYTVASTGCSDLKATTGIKINDLPTAFTLTGPDGATGAFCTNGTPATFTLSGSQEGVTYTFNSVNPGGNTPPGQNFTVPGVGGTLEFVQTPDGKWSYKVTGTDDATGCTNTMEGLLTAVDGPAITSQPQSVSVCTSGAATITLNASNASSLKWEVSTDNGSSWTTVTSNSIYTINTSGTTSTKLTISNAAASMNSYQYRAVLGGPSACPVNYSNVAVLTVNQPPVITKQPVSKAVCHNSTMILSVGATNAAGYQWYLNGAAIAGATGAEYRKTYDAATDAGTYSVLVKSNAPCGNLASNSVTVSTAPPSVTTWQGPLPGSGATSGTAWEVASNWSCGVPTRSTDAVIPADVIDGYPTIKPAVTGEVRNLTLNGGGFSPYLTVNGKLQIFGSVTNNGGVFDATAGTIEFSGSTVQTLSAGLFAGNTVQNLVISNDVNLAGELNLTGALSFGAVSNKTLATNDYLTLKSGSATTARVSDLTNNGSSTGNAITGKVTVERYIPAFSNRRWRLVTSPVAGISVHDAWQEGRSWNGSNNEMSGYGTLITGNAQGTSATATDNGFDFWTAVAGSSASIRKYVPSNSNINANWVPLENTISPGFSNLEAYLVFIRGDRTVSTGTAGGTTTLRAKGTLKQAVAYTIPVPVTYSHVLVGNPYASPLDFRKLYADNSTKIQPYYWIWNAGQGTSGGYMVMQPSATGGYEAIPAGGTGSGSAIEPIIGSGEGFFVVPATNAATGNTLTLQETHKSNGQPGFSVFRQVRTEVAKLSVNLYAQVDGENIRLDGVLAQYGASPEKCGGIAKLANIEENLSIPDGAENLIVASRGGVQSGDSLQLRLWNAAERGYHFTFKGSGFLAQGPKAVLYDRYSRQETEVPLTGEETDYAFGLTNDSASKDPRRFVIRFRTAAATARQARALPVTPEGKPAFVFPNPVKAATTNLVLSGKSPGRYTVRLFTASGQLLRVQAVQYSGGLAVYPVSARDLAGGTYTLVLAAPDGRQEQVSFVVIR
ncbi:T9SS type A sorting domain-containing protein [Flavisolibacter nicotianae]|uniref:T9SS type A sorting domain-containing protein n=1 Tax=Flavisolibacter nicotianae TaxID=2364882 RepID=UPI000EB2FB1C|nr:T9SS type A sorting domain-containing protein [Flavisolibacter nicotianae]